MLVYQRVYGTINITHGSSWMHVQLPTMNHPWTCSLKIGLEPTSLQRALFWMFLSKKKWVRLGLSPSICSSVGYLVASPQHSMWEAKRRWYTDTPFSFEVAQEDHRDGPDYHAHERKGAGSPLPCLDCLAWKPEILFSGAVNDGWLDGNLMHLLPWKWSSKPMFFFII
jgi:hypothetical protein